MNLQSKKTKKKTKWKTKNEDYPTFFASILLNPLPSAAHFPSLLLY